MALQWFPRPIYGGWVDSKGPRNCPSIEDKIVKFASKESHPVFLEPEGRRTAELYVQGCSTGLPERLQLGLLRTLPGLEQVRTMLLCIGWALFLRRAMDSGREG